MTEAFRRCQLVSQMDDLLLESADAHGLTHDVQDLVRLNRLLKEAVGSALYRFPRRVLRIACGDYHDRYRRPLAASRLDDRQAFRQIANMRRQMQVTQDDVNTFALEQLDGFIPRRRLEHAIIFLECPKKSTANCVIVLNHEHSSFRFRL